MQFDNVVQYTLEHNGGTFYSDGQPVSQARGYAVGGFTTEYKVPVSEFDALHVRVYIETYAAELSEPGLYLGTWIHDGYVVLDVSAIIPSRTIALAAGRGLDQRAVYNFASGNNLAI